MNAVVMVHWPGKDTPACIEHALKLERAALAMGFTVSATPLTGTDEEVPCANCENEAKKS